MPKVSDNAQTIKYYMNSLTAGLTLGSSRNSCAAGSWYHYPSRRLSFLDLGHSLLANVRIIGVQEIFLNHST